MTLKELLIRVLGLPLLSADQRILNYSGVTTLK